MNLVKSEKLEKNQHELQFSIDAASFNDAIAKAYKREAGKYNIPGFRKGKAPRHMIEKMYGEDVFQYSAVNDLFPAEYDKAVEASGIEPVDRPEVDIVSMQHRGRRCAESRCDGEARNESGQLYRFKAEKAANTVEDAAVDAEVNRLRERNARLVAREGKAQDGDTADIDFEGFVDGEAFDGGKGEHFSLTLGSGQFIPGFEEQIVGHEAGEEFDVNVTFPEDYHAKELAGKAAVFKVKLNEVQYKELPVADDEFAKDVSEYDTLDEFKASIRKNMEEAAEKQAELEVENALVDQLVATLEGDIPPVMIETRIDEMVRDFDYRLSQQGLRLADYLKYTGGDEAKFREGFKEQAEKQVKMRLALEAVAKAENIEASEEDFENEVKRIADTYKMEVEKVRSIIPVAEVKKDLAVNKAIDFIKSKAEDHCQES